MAGERRAKTSWVQRALEAIEAGEPAVVRPRGGSMRGRIEDGQQVTIAPCDGADVAIEDVVFIRWKGGYLLHRVADAEPERLLIANNVGKTNGWASRDDVLGRVVALGPLAP